MGTSRQPSNAPAPAGSGLKPRPRLFAVMLVLFALWLAGLIVLNAVT